LNLLINWLEQCQLEETRHFGEMLNCGFGTVLTQRHPQWFNITKPGCFHQFADAGFRARQSFERQVTSRALSESHRSSVAAKNHTAANLADSDG
jgi:hypothetical protein